MWLASTATRNRKTGKIIRTDKLAPDVLYKAIVLLREAVEGRGDPERERLFRMNATICLHRVLSTEDRLALDPAFFRAEPIDIAGGPVEIIWESVEGSASTRPCKRPRKKLIDRQQPELWVPVDCGICEPCIARAQIDSYHPITIS